MEAWTRTCGRRRSRQHDPKCRLKSSQYILIIPHKVIQLTTKFLRQRQGCASNKSTNRSVPPKRVNYRHCHPFLFLLYPHPQERRGKARRTGRIFLEHVERSFLDPERSFVAVRQITRTRFPKQKFAQLRTSYVLAELFSGSTNTPN